MFLPRFLEWARDPWMSKGQQLSKCFPFEFLLPMRLSRKWLRGISKEDKLSTCLWKSLSWKIWISKPNSNVRSGILFWTYCLNVLSLFQALMKRRSSTTALQRLEVVPSDTRGVSSKIGHKNFLFMKYILPVYFIIINKNERQKQYVSKRSHTYRSMERKRNGIGWLFEAGSHWLTSLRNFCWSWTSSAKIPHNMKYKNLRYYIFSVLDAVAFQSSVLLAYKGSIKIATPGPK